jgi:hypothetical protein
MQPEFDSFATHRLALHVVNVPDDNNLVENVTQQLNTQQVLRVTEKLSDLFQEPLQREQYTYLSYLQLLVSKTAHVGIAFPLTKRNPQRMAQPLCLYSTLHLKVQCNHTMIL